MNIIPRKSRSYFHPFLCVFVSFKVFTCALWWAGYFATFLSVHVIVLCVVVCNNCLLLFLAVGPLFVYFYRFPKIVFNISKKRVNHKKFSAFNQIVSVPGPGTVYKEETMKIKDQNFLLLKQLRCCSLHVWYIMVICRISQSLPIQKYRFRCFIFSTCIYTWVTINVLKFVYAVEQLLDQMKSFLYDQNTYQMQHWILAEWCSIKKFIQLLNHLQLSFCA